MVQKKIPFSLVHSVTMRPLMKHALGINMNKKENALINVLLNLYGILLHKTVMVTKLVLLLKNILPLLIHVRQLLKK